MTAPRRATADCRSRVREAMRVIGLEPMGGAGKVVEVDETFSGKQEGHAKAKGHYHMNVVLTLVERGGPTSAASPLIAH
jgi:hypothetical protein